MSRFLSAASSSKRGLLHVSGAVIIIKKEGLYLTLLNDGEADDDVWKFASHRTFEGFERERDQETSGTHTSQTVLYH